MSDKETRSTRFLPKPYPFDPTTRYQPFQRLTARWVISGVSHDRDRGVVCDQLGDCVGGPKACVDRKVYIIKLIRLFLFRSNQPPGYTFREKSQHNNLIQSLGYEEEFMFNMNFGEKLV